MSRPRSESEYLSRLVPSSVSGVSRRGFLKATAGAGGVVGLSALLAACGDDDGGGGGSGTGTVTFGSNQSDEIPKKAYATMLANAQKVAGVEVKVNTIDHNTFQENINNYLQGKPDDVFTWFAGYRMQFFAEKGLIGDVSDVWQNITGMSDPLKTASTGSDGKQYFVPLTNYPWAVFYRKSLFAEKGYTVPKTLDEYKALGAQMKQDGLIPIAFADKDGWPAFGTFDILNMRINGYQFHIDLMAGKVAWTDAKVKTVFDTWRGLLPLHQEGSLGRTWQESAQALQKKEAGTYLLGTFVAQQFPKEEQDDLDFFPFPEVDSTIGADALDAPIDGFLMAKEPRNPDGAKKLLAALAKPAAGQDYVASDPSVIAVSSEADTSKYSTLQLKAVELMNNAKSIAQFLDRDTRPDFSSTVMIPSIQEFIKSPDKVDSILSSIESQKKTIFSA
jgi:multiple sugar transport system substrate-binding protein